VRDYVDNRKDIPFKGTETIWNGEPCQGKNVRHSEEFMDTPWFYRGVSKNLASHSLFEKKSALIMTAKRSRRLFESYLRKGNLRNHPFSWWGVRIIEAMRFVKGRKIRLYGYLQQKKSMIL
jgi:hypothetical protein